MSGAGPLYGLRVVEFAGIGPGPFAAMMLADMGADLIRVARPGQPSLFGDSGNDVVSRGRPTVELDLKAPGDRDATLKLLDRAEALIEGFRPGVMERLGLGPDEVLTRNPRLVYGRVTGYGQSGPLAHAAGHDINYISVAGALGAIAREGERPLFPLNLVGDYGGGGMLLAFGILCAIIEARGSGHGQVVDAAMVDGAAIQTALIHGLRANGLWSDRAGTNMLDSGAHFYEVYATADGGHVAVGPLEPQFYAALVSLLEIDPLDAPQWDRARWPALKRQFAEIFGARPTEHWRVLFEGSEACGSIVLGPGEAPLHPHNIARDTFVEHGGVVQPAPAPRFSRTPGRIRDDPPDAERLLRRWGVEP